MGASGKSDRETGALLYFLVQDIRETSRTLAANAASGAADAAGLKERLDRDFDRWIGAIGEMAPYRAFTEQSASQHDAFGALQEMGYRASPPGRAARGFRFVTSTLWRTVFLGALFLAGLALAGLVFLAYRTTMGEALTHFLSGLSRVSTLGWRPLLAEFAGAPRTLFGLTLSALMALYLMLWLALAGARARRRFRNGFAALLLALIVGIFCGLLASLRF